MLSINYFPQPAVAPTVGNSSQRQPTSITLVTWVLIFKNRGFWTSQLQLTQLSSRWTFHRQIHELQRWEQLRQWLQGLHHGPLISIASDRQFRSATPLHCHALRARLTVASHRSMKRWSRQATESLNHVRASQVTIPVQRHHRPS